MLARETNVESRLPAEPARIVPLKPLTVLIVVPTLDAGAADQGALELVRILVGAGHKAIVVSRGGRLVKDVLGARGEFVRLPVDSKNPFVMLRNGFTLAKLIRERGCDAIHAHGRAPAWSAFFAARRTGVPLLTSWYKGFREQNVFKRFYNRIMVRGECVIAASEQIAQLINDRYGTPWDRISVVPGSIDFQRFDITKMTPERIEEVRSAWGVGPDTRIILVVGRMLRRKGHHVMVRAVRRLKDMGLKDFLCGVIRMGGVCSDLPAAYAAASIVVSAAVQPEGMQRAILEAQAMARPVAVSDLGADVVLSPPAVPEHRMTGLRFAADDDQALAETLLHLFSMPEATRHAIGARGREWVLGHFSDQAVAEQTLAVYARLSPTAHRPGAAA
jgi:glycosyltransferase involved in cell wall biosynthesis